MPLLADLGWDAAREREFEPYEASGLAPARVSLEHNHVYRVMSAEAELLAEAAGRIKFRAGARKELPAVGDWVAIRQDPSESRATIRGILSRRTEFTRKAPGKPTAEQVLAANVDVAFIVFGLDKPANPRAIERYVALVRRSGAEPIVVLNKSDVAEKVAEAIREAVGVAAGASVHAVQTRSPGGVDPLEPYLVHGRTVAMLGPSGVGKSSIVNRLLGEDRLKTGEVRDWDQRGRHTSVHRQLVVRPAGGVIVDTPGMRELQIWDGDEALSETFDDVTELAADCRFRDCRHDAEPGCAVKAAVAGGALEEARYQNFLKLAREHQALEKQRTERTQKTRGR